MIRNDEHESGVRHALENYPKVYGFVPKRSIYNVC